MLIFRRPKGTGLGIHLAGRADAWQNIYGNRQEMNGISFISKALAFELHLLL